MLHQYCSIIFSFDPPTRCVTYCNDIPCRLLHRSTSTGCIPYRANICKMIDITDTRTYNKSQLFHNLESSPQNYEYGYFQRSIYKCCCFLLVVTIGHEVEGFRWLHKCWDQNGLHNLSSGLGYVILGCAVWGKKCLH